MKSVELAGLVAVKTKSGWILNDCVCVGRKTQSVNFFRSSTSEVRIGGENDRLEKSVETILGVGEFKKKINMNSYF